MPIPTKPLNEQKQTAKEKIYNTLLEWITDGTMQPGEKIVDTEIAQYFSFSRTPVREALQMLADQKLIDVVPGKESRVSAIDIEQAKSNYFLMANFNTIALDMCSEKIDAAFIDNLKNINNRMKKVQDESKYKEILNFDKQFHFAFFELANNYFLTSAAKNLYAHCVRIENIYFSERNDYLSSLKLHDEIIQALLSKDILSAKEKLSRNWMDTVKDL